MWWFWDCIFVRTISFIFSQNVVTTGSVAATHKSVSTVTRRYFINSTYTRLIVKVMSVTTREIQLSTAGSGSIRFYSTSSEVLPHRNAWTHQEDQLIPPDHVATCYWEMANSLNDTVNGVQYMYIRRSII